MSRITSTLSEIGKVALASVAILVAVSLVVGMGTRAFGGWMPTDDTDLSKRVRSGMTPLTDYGTGCQYLTAPGGGVTPRLDPQGRPICTGPMK